MIDPESLSNPGRDPSEVWACTSPGCNNSFVTLEAVEDGGNDNLAVVTFCGQCDEVFTALVTIQELEYYETEAEQRLKQKVVQYQKVEREAAAFIGSLAEIDPPDDL